MKKLTKKQVRDYVKSRYPGVKFNRAADCWQKPGRSWALSVEIAHIEAEAEVEFFYTNYKTNPMWYE